MKVFSYGENVKEIYKINQTQLRILYLVIICMLRGPTSLSVLPGLFG